MKYKCVKCGKEFKYTGCYAKLKCPKCYSRNVLSIEGYTKMKENGSLSILKDNNAG